MSRRGYHSFYIMVNNNPVRIFDDTFWTHCIKLNPANSLFIITKNRRYQGAHHLTSEINPWYPGEYILWYYKTNMFRIVSSIFVLKYINQSSKLLLFTWQNNRLNLMVQNLSESCLHSKMWPSVVSSLSQHSSPHLTSNDEGGVGMDINALLH